MRVYCSEDYTSPSEYNISIFSYKRRNVILQCEECDCIATHISRHHQHIYNKYRKCGMYQISYKLIICATSTFKN